MSRKLSVETEERRQKDYAEGLKDQELAEKWGVGKPAVSIWRLKRGLKPHGKRGRQITVEEEERRQQGYAKGLKDPELARIWGVTRAAVCLWRQRHDLKPHGSRGDGGTPRKHFSCILWGVAFKGKFDPGTKVSGTDTDARQVAIARSNSKDWKQAKRRGWSILQVRRTLTALDGEQKA